MATSQQYFDLALHGYARITSGVTATDGSGSLTSVTWNTTPAHDYMLTDLIITASSATGVGNPADCLVQMFLDNGGSNARKFLTVDLGDPAVGSTTVPEYFRAINLGMLILPAAVVPKFSVSVTPTAGNIDFMLFGQASST